MVNAAIFNDRGGGGGGEKNISRSYITIIKELSGSFAALVPT